MKSFIRGLALQFEVVHALVLRETRTRFGAHQMGYLWAILEPCIVILTFFEMFRIAGRAVPEGMDAFTFICTGIVPYTLFSNSATRVAEAINGNKALLFYPQVKPLDLVIARVVLETATFIAVFAILMLAHALWLKSFEMDSVLLTLEGLIYAALLGSAIGLVFCGLGQISNVADRARGPLLRPLFWVSGIFFTAGDLSDRARELMLINPVMHATEMVRDGWFTTYDDDYVNRAYVWMWILAMFSIGLLLERNVRRRIELS